MSKSKVKFPYIFILPSVLGCGVFLFVPYLDVIRRTFFDVAGNFCGMDNYKELFINEAFCVAMKNTGAFMAVCIPILMVLSLMIALLIFENPKSSAFLRTGFLIPMAIPVASVVLVWRLFFDYNGILNGILQGIGFTTINWMESSAAFWILVGSYIWKNLGYNIILWLASLSAIEPMVLEAAKVDGATSLQLYWHIYLPQIKIQAYSISVLAILNSFKVFREVYLVAGDYPNDSIYLMQHLFNNWFRNIQVEKIATASVIDSAVLILLILFLQHSWVRRDCE